MRRLLHHRPFLVTLPTIGITVSDVFVAVCISGKPIRITGVYRQRLNDATKAGRAEAIRSAAITSRRVLRAPIGSQAVLAFDPIGCVVDVALTDGWVREPLPIREDSSTVSAFEEAGYSIRRLDALPAALARFARCSLDHHGQISACGWTVSVSDDRLEAETEAARWTLDRGERQREAHTIAPDLRNVRIPEAVLRHLRIETDAAAIGAALRGFGVQPDLLVTPVQPSAASVTTTPQRAPTFSPLAPPGGQQRQN